MQETSYEPITADVSQAIFVERISQLFLSLDTTDVTYEEEYTLQDFSGIVATLGGSIGIFLGWSLFDLFKTAGNFLDSVMKKGGCCF